MTKKFFTVALCLCLAAGAFAQYSGGDGTVNDPYLISTKADMEALATAVNGGTNYTGKYFLLTADLTGITTIIGLEYARPFKGNFDGGGHVLNVTIRTDG
ncbi:MAG: hypothetical protein LBL33_04365, partial [Tannerella sp.]|nr:hypothetical protein [Tannerella sp.]